MNVRFAEPCRPTPFELLDFEEKVFQASRRDGRSLKELTLPCEKDIFIGVFFDGTNNNKYRDTPGYSHSNVARLYEVYPGTNAAQTPPTLAPRVLPGGGKEARPVFADKAFKAASIPAEDYPYYRKIYVPGLGTPMPDACDTGTGMQKTGGLALALLSQVRLDWALLQLVNQIHAVIFGQPLESSVKLHSLFRQAGKENAKPSLLKKISMGLMPQLAVAEIVDQYWAEFDHEVGTYDPAAFDRLLKSYLQRLDKAMLVRRNNKPHLRKIRLSVFGFSRGATEARAWINMLNDRWTDSISGIPLQIDFMGLFDTVASVGVAHAAPPIFGLKTDGHYAWASVERLAVPANVRRCVHLVAAHEVRGAFPLDSVCQGNQLPSNCKEIVYPGVHSDVGGGYPPDDQGRCLGSGAAGDQLKLSQISLAQMYREARMGGVPLAAESDMLTFHKTNFAIAPQLRADFNAYIEATRTGKLAPTNGRGDPTFAAMYPTETQPRGELHRIMRHHYGILLRWRKATAQRAGGAAGLPGLKQSNTSSKFQDMEDFRGAEQELLKEIAFLQSKDLKKFTVFDDPMMDKAKRYADATGNLPLLPWVRWAKVFGLILSWGLQDSVRSVMEEKQMQWDTWLREEWFADDLGVPPSAMTLFEHYVHDSRAWFKPGLRADNEEMMPDDEDWFVFGAREQERQARLAKANKLIASGDAAQAKSAKTEAQLMQAEGAPLLFGGREPYRMWGYVRHRQIYQAGQLKEAGYTTRQASIEKQEQERETQRRREEALARENARHDAEVKAVKARNREVLLEPARSNRDKDAYTEGARNKLARENEFHQQELKRINQAFAPAAH